MDPRKRRQQDFALGLTAIVVFLLFLGTVVFLYPNLGARGKTLLIHFRHEDGMAPLKPGSAVLLGGSVPVGRVRTVRLQTAPRDVGASLPPHLVFAVEVELDATLELYGDCQITTDQPAIGGSGFVTILNVGTPGHPLVQPIPGRPPQSFQAAVGTLARRLLSEGGLIDQLSDAADPAREGSLMYKIVAVADDLNAMTRTLRTQLDAQQQQTLLSKLHEVLDDLAATTAAVRGQMRTGDPEATLGKLQLVLDRLGEGLAHANALLDDSRPLVMDTLTSVAHAARKVDEELLVQLQRELDPANPDSLTGKTHQAMDQVQAALANVQALTTEGERMVAVNRPMIESAIRNLKATSEALLHGIQELALDPSRLLFGPGPQRGRQILVFQAARSFATAASELNDASGRLEAVVRTLPASGPLSPADQQELEAVRTTLRTSFERFEAAEQALWELLK